MQNFVQRVFVGKTTGAITLLSPVGTVQTPATPLQIIGQPFVPAGLVLGDLLLVDENGIILDNTTVAAATRVRVIRGVGSGKVQSSSIIVKGTPSTRYTSEAYTAPVAQVSTFTALALLPNTQYQLQVVIPQDLPLISNRQNRIIVSLFTGATVSTADIDRLVVNFNKQRDTLGIIVASRSGGNLVLTGKTIPTVGIADYEFVRFDCNFVTLTSYNATTGISTNLSLKTAVQADIIVAALGGKGIAIQVRQLERVALGYSGFTSPREQWFRGPFPYGAVDGVNYDILNVQQQISGEGMLQDSKTYPVSTLIATLSGGGQGAATANGMSALLTLFLGLSPE